MSSWLAAPLAAVLMIAIGAAALVVIWLIGWLVERIEGWIGENRFNAIGGVFSLCVALLVVCLVWFLLFASLKGWT